jgi:hypothetical protein
MCWPTPAWRPDHHPAAVGHVGVRAGARLHPGAHHHAHLPHPDGPRFGQATASSIYRFYERISNIGGPLLISGILVASNYSPFSVVWIGSAVLLFGLLFAISPARKPAEAIGD